MRQQVRLRDQVTAIVVVVSVALSRIAQQNETLGAVGRVGRQTASLNLLLIGSTRIRCVADAESNVKHFAHTRLSLCIGALRWIASGADGRHTHRRTLDCFANAVDDVFYATRAGSTGGGTVAVARRRGRCRRRRRRCSRRHCRRSRWRNTRHRRVKLRVIVVRIHRASARACT